MFLSLHFTSAFSQTYPARGAGTYTCAEFAQQYKESPQFVETLYFSWAQGFMTGQTLGARIKRDLGGDIETQKGILRKYCADNPLKSYGEAVVDLYARHENLCLEHCAAIISQPPCGSRLASSRDAMPGGIEVRPTARNLIRRVNVSFFENRSDLRPP